MLRRIGGVLLTPVIVMIIITAAIVGGCQQSNTGNSTSGTTTSKHGVKTATIRITGTPGIAFSGNYHSSAASGSMNGTTPQDFEVDYESGFGAFDIVSATAQKKAEDNSKLTAQILVDNQVKKEQSTSAAFGVVTVRWNTNE
jgi:hypothetical protein